MARRIWILFVAVACVILVAIGLVVLRPQSDPPKHVFEEMHRVLTTDRPGPLAKVEHLEPYRISNNQESEAFEDYGFWVQEECLPHLFLEIYFSVEPHFARAEFTYRVDEDLYIVGTFSFYPFNSLTDVKFQMVGANSPYSDSDLVPREVVVEELAKLGLMPEDVEQEIFAVFNEFFIGPWTEVYDSEFSVDDWGELTINNEGLRERPAEAE